MTAICVTAAAATAAAAAATTAMTVAESVCEFSRRKCDRSTAYVWSRDGGVISQTGAEDGSRDVSIYETGQLEMPAHRAAVHVMRRGSKWGGGGGRRKR